MLNENQVTEIRNFCHSKGIVYYDLEQEIVDHLASVVEEEQNRFPDKSFDEILQTKATEFSAEWKMIETEKRKALRNEYLREFGKEFKSYFTIPKIALTITLIVCAIMLSELRASKIVLSVNNYSVIINISNLIIIFFNSDRNKFAQRLKKKRRKELIIWNTHKIMFISLQMIYLFYFLAMFIPSAFSKFTFPELKVFIDIYPLVLIFVFANIKTSYKVLEKINENYPLAFQS